MIVYKQRPIKVDPNDGWVRTCFGIRKIRTRFTWFDFERLPLPKKNYVKFLHKGPGEKFYDESWTINDDCDCKLCTGEDDLFSQEQWNRHNHNYNKATGQDWWP